MTLPALGIQSYCFRNFRTIDELVRVTQECGLTRLEIWPGHIAHDEPESPAKIARLKEVGIAVSSYGQVSFKGKPDEDEHVFRWAADLGLKAVTAMFAADQRDNLAARAQEYGIALAVHNHGSRHEYGKIDQLAALLDGAPGNVGLCLDTAWMMEAGEDPLAALDRFGDRVFGIHLKDFKFHGDGSYTDVPIGDGDLALDEVLTRAHQLPHLAYLSLEYEGEPDAPQEPIRKAVQRFAEKTA